MSKPTLEDAIILATTLHRGQVDKAGARYILHPLRVMCDPSLTTENERITAVLHDVVEDCDITFDELREREYDEEVVEALGFLTKLPGEDYGPFIRRVCSGSVIARKVKWADLRDNSNLSRIPDPTPWDLKRNEKYVQAMTRIEESFTALWE